MDGKVKLRRRVAMEMGQSHGSLSKPSVIISATDKTMVFDDYN